MAVTQSAKANSDDIIGFKKDIFWEIVKQGAIAGAIFGGIEFAGGFLAGLLSWFGLFSFGSSLLFGAETISSLFRDVILGAIWGIATVILVIKFYDKLPFDTMFKKVFGIRIIIALLTMFSFGLFLIIFLGPISFVLIVGSIILADYVYAKMISSKVGPLVGLK